MRDGRLLVSLSWSLVVGGPLAAQNAPVGVDTAPRVGAVAPGFALVTLSGDTVRLGALRGRPVLVNFWASWCVPCKSEMPLLVAAYVRHREAGLMVLAVNLTDQESLGEVRRFVEAYRMPFPVLLDRQGKVRRAYALRGVPTSVFIDAHGLIRTFHRGPVGADTLHAGLGEILQVP
jgi:thiol-disulfide isomerase/thioredoxin